MTRSAHVWVVIDVETLTPVAAFTVKHELARWQVGRRAEEYALWRLRWNGPQDQERVWLDWATLDPVEQEGKGS